MSERLLPLATTKQAGGCGCGCSTGPAAGGPDSAGAETTGPATISSTFLVTGMTCGHCVAAVTQEVRSGVPGVADVQVDLASGRVTVVGDRPAQENDVREAVEEAGYQLVSGSVQ